MCITYSNPLFHPPSNLSTVSSWLSTLVTSGATTTSRVVLELVGMERLLKRSTVSRQHFVLGYCTTCALRCVPCTCVCVCVCVCVWCVCVRACVPAEVMVACFSLLSPLLTVCTTPCGPLWSKVPEVSCVRHTPRYGCHANRPGLWSRSCWLPSKEGRCVKVRSLGGKRVAVDTAAKC